MVNPMRVEVDDGERQPSPRRQRPRLGWLAVGVAGGFVASFLVFGAEPLQPAVSESAADAAVEEPSPGIGETIPGFKDGLVAVTRTDSETLDLTIWPVAGPYYDRDVPLGTSMTRQDVRFDLSGRRIAATHFVPGEAFSGLVAGVPESVALVDIGVTGFAWSDSTPGSLAYTTIEDEIMNLWVLDIGSAEPEHVAVLTGIGGGLVAWGEWGYAIEDVAAEQVMLLTTAGEPKRAITGRFLGSHGNGSLVVFDGEVTVHGSVLGIRDFGGRYEVVGVPFTAEISPDARKLAVLGSEGLLVLPLEGDSAVVQADPRNGIPQIAWTTDNRFILLPGVRGLTIVDTRGSRLDYVLGDRSVHGVAVLPVSD
ncbi:MAG: hypothetical protein ACR2NL_10900 [Acidimicrobiia bacterium]